MEQNRLIESTAQEIAAAYAGAPIAPVRTRIPDVATAYAVQQANVRRWLDEGRVIVGRKIGLTAKAVQEQLGVDEPDFGVLFEDMVVPNGASVPFSRVAQPRVEAEIAFVLGQDLFGADLSPQDVLAATASIRPALEICGSRIQNWDIKIADTVADNASSGLIVLGDAVPAPTLDELPAFTVRLSQNGGSPIEGSGAACLGNPAIAVAWLASALHRFGEGLRKGDVVMSGAMAKMLPAVAGDRFEADFAKLGTVSVEFRNVD